MSRSLVIAVIACALGLGLSAPVLALGTGSSELDSVTYGRAHPVLGGDVYSIFNAATGREQSLTQEGFVKLDAISSPFMSQTSTFEGVLNSEAWQAQDGHMLFLYQLVNTSPTTGMQHAITMGNTADLWWERYGITDCGVIHDASMTSPRVAGDAMWMMKTNDAEVSFGFNDWRDKSWQIMPGQSSSWIYLETNAPGYGSGLASVINGSGVEGIRTFVPMPEPLTVLGLIAAAGAAGAYLRRRGIAVQ